VYRSARTGFGQPLKITFGDKGWVTFKTAMELRHHVTYPKVGGDCWIFETQLQTVTLRASGSRRSKTSSSASREHTASNTAGSA
jgi:hypothetical protein